MKKNLLFKKTFIIVLIGFFIGHGTATNILTTTIVSLHLENINNLSDSFNDIIIETTPKIEFGVVKGGFGLNIEIKNVGDVDISDVSINISSTGGYKIDIPIDSYRIPFFPAGSRENIEIKISGIGLGIVEDFPKITVIANAPHIHPAEIGVILRIIGPLVTIIGDFVNDPRSFEGYTIFTPEWYTDTYLINNSGEVVHSWSGSNLLNGLGSLLLENGHMIRSAIPWPNPRFMAGGILGRVEEFDWNGSRVWYFDYTNQYHCHHHGVEVLPNGNILMIAWEYKTAEEAIKAGRNPDLLPQGELYPDHIIEVKPVYPNGGIIVWEWHLWDHLIQDYDPSKDNFGEVAAHPELIDINFGPPTADWNHINSVDYNPELDQIVLSVRHFSEFWVIDHSTTTEEAASHTGGRYGHGGDILYRWGNPQAYRAGTIEDQKLFEQHDVQWIEKGCPGEGNFLIFNNGNGRPGGEYSSIEEIIPPVDEEGFYHKIPYAPYGPEESFWRYTADNPFDFFSDHISGCQRLPNGNTLICDGAHGYFFEVTLDGKIVWEYLNRFPNLFDNLVFKIHRYAPDYPGLKNLFSS